MLLIRGLFGAMLLVASVAGAQPVIIPNTPAIISLAEMTDEDYADFREGRLGDIVVRIEEGSVLKGKFYVVSDTFALDKNPTMAVRVLRTLFLRVLNGELQFSFDCTKWGSLPEIFLPNLAMMISVEHNAPTGAIAFFLESRH